MVQNFISYFSPQPSTVIPEILNTSLILLGVSLVIMFSAYIIRRQDWSTIKQRQYLSFIRNFALVLGLCLLFFTWRGEIKAFIFSVSALTVGIFVAFKEIILSFFSYFIISSNQLFKIGDVIELDDKIGKVVDRSLLYTKISLVGTHHSKEVVIPNVLFTTGKFVNLSANEFFSKTLAFHTSPQNLKAKKVFLEQHLKEQLKDTICTLDFYIDSQTLQEISIKIVVKNLSSTFDFNTFKNEAVMVFFEQYPTILENYPSKV